MNIDTGHLISSDYPDFEELIRNRGYVEIPPVFQVAAKKKLAGRHETMVSLKRGGKLSRFAASERKKHKRKGKSWKRVSGSR